MTSATDNNVELHPLVKEIAAGLALKNGQLEMTEANLAKHRNALRKLSDAGDKKLVLVSLVALAARLMREGNEASAQAVVRLMELAAELIGDVKKAQAVFESAGIKPKK